MAAGGQICLAMVEEQPKISARRRLQNRDAQRKFREKKAQQKAAQAMATDAPQQEPEPSTASSSASASASASSSSSASAQDVFNNGALLTESNIFLGLPSSSSADFSDGSEQSSRSWCTDQAFAQMATPFPTAANTPGSNNAHHNPPFYALSQTSFSPPPNVASQSSGIAQLQRMQHQLQQQHQQQSHQQGQLTGSTSSNNSDSPQSKAKDDASYRCTYSMVSLDGPSHSPSANPSYSTALASSPLLHIATRSRSQSVMRVLLRRSAAFINERDVDGRTALHVAAEMGDQSLVCMLLDQGADPSARDHHDRDALYIAVEGGYCEIVEMLLDRIQP